MLRQNLYIPNEIVKTETHIMNVEVEEIDKLLMEEGYVSFPISSLPSSFTLSFILTVA